MLFLQDDKIIRNLRESKENIKKGREKSQKIYLKQNLRKILLKIK